MSSNGTGSSKWPDFRLASTLRSLVPGLQSKRPDKQNNDNAAGHDHDNKQQHESEPQNELHEDLNLPSRMAHENMETEDHSIDGIGGLDSYDNDVQAGSDNDDQDQDFGVLEMFDSNATQAPYSSQLNNASYDEKAPEALMTEEAPSSQTRKHKRDKKERKRKSTSDDASLQLLTEEDSSRKQRKSKKNSAQVAEIPDSLAEKNSSNAFQSLPQQISAVDLYDDDATPATPVTQAKRKRNSSDSTDGKQRKKRRSRDDGVAAESQDIVPETQEGAQSTLEGTNTRDSPAASFSRTRNASHPGAIDDGVAEDPPESPRSREGSAAPDEMDLDVSTAQGKQEEKGSGPVESREANGSQNTHNEDVERMAREAWNEHVINAQNNTKTQDSADQHDKIDIPTSAQRQQTTQDVYDIPGSPLQTPSAPIASAKKSRTASAKTKKAKPTFFEKSPSPEQDDLAPLASPSATAQAPPKRAKKTSNRKKSEANVSRSMQAGQDEEEPRAAGARRDRMDNHTKGRFSEEELGRIAKAVEAYRSANDMEQYQLNTMIHAPGGTAAGEEHAAFWDRIFATCPDRHRQKIINITRKKFHNFVARGAWTTEQDQELRDLIETNGKKWSKIAGIINRHPEDLRDRYRNYIICGASQQKDRWTEEEEQKLVEVVMHTIDAIDQQRHDNPNDTRFQRPYVELIDWQTISEQMGRKRSRLQCMTKWKAMNIKTHVKDQLASAAPDASITFRLEKARRQIAAMPDEERYRMVLAIHNSSARIESKIPWQRLVDKTFRASWHRPTQMLLWRRLKRTVPGFQEKSVRDCATYLMDLYSQTGELPNVEDTLYDDAEEVEFVNSIPIGQINSSTPANGQNISAEYITEADEDGDEYQAGEEADEHQTGEYGMVDENIQPDLPIAPMEDYSPAPTASMDPVAPVADLAPMEPAEMVDPALSAEPMPLEEIEEEVPPSVEEQGLINKPVGTPVFAEPAPPKATRVAKRTGFGKAKPPKAPRKSSARSTPVKSTPTRRSTRRAAAPSQDPIEDSEGTQPSAPADDDSEVEDAKTRKRKTPSRFRSTTTTELPTAADDSDSVMDDMEDMPARIR